MARKVVASNSRRTRIAPAESYLFRIEQARPDYSFGANESSRDAHTFSEYLHPQINATCLSPHKLEGRLTKFTIIGSRPLGEELRKPSQKFQPDARIGTLTMRGAQSDYLGSVPFDAAMIIPTLILLQGYRFIYLSGEPMYRGSAAIRYIGFHHEFDLPEL